MDDPRDKKGEIIDFLTEKSRINKKQGIDKSIKIDGNNNIVGNNNTIVNTARHTTKVVAEPKPGEEHIDERQVRRLHDLKDEIIRLEQLAKRNPATPQRVWGALNKHVRVGAMRMIPKARFSKAEKYLLNWIGQLTARPAVNKKDPQGVRKRRIAYIQINMKQLGIEEKVRDYMERHYDVRSLTQLPDLASLERVYRYVAGLKSNS